MLRTALGASKHSRAFRRAMALELRPLRSYSVEQPPTTNHGNKIRCCQRLHEKSTNRGYPRI